LEEATNVDKAMGKQPSIPSIWENKKGGKGQEANTTSDPLGGEPPQPQTK
jgi:hypothetical protein